MRSAILLVLAGTALVQAAHLKGAADAHSHSASGARALNPGRPLSAVGGVCGLNNPVLVKDAGNNSSFLLGLT